MKKMFFVFLLCLTGFVKAQTTLVPYRVGKLWGLSDTLGKMVVAPTYDEIDPDAFRIIKPNQRTTTGYFLVNKNGKYGVIANGKLIMPAKHYKLRIDTVFITEDNSDPNNPTMGGSRRIFYNLRGEKLITDTLIDIEPIASKFANGHSFYKAWGRNKSGIFWYDRQTQKIMQWLVKDMYDVGTWRAKEGLYLYAMKAQKSPELTFKAVFDKVQNKYNITASGKPVFAPREDEERSGSMYPSYLTVNNNYMNVTVQFYTKDDKVFLVRKSRRNKSNAEKIDTVYFNVVNDKLATKKYANANSDFWHNTTPMHHTSLMEKLDTAFIYANYISYEKNRKKGVIVDDFVVPAVYNDVIYTNGMGYSRPIFMVSQLDKATNQLKWGIIDRNNKVIIPMIYDEIRKRDGSNACIVKKGAAYGVIRLDGKVLLPAKYEKIIPDAIYSSFTILHQDKYGYLSTWNNKQIEPVLPYRVNRAFSFGTFELLELYDSKDKLMGYSSLKGKLFFSAN